MSTNVGIVVLLCLCLIFAMIRHRSSQANGTKRTLRMPASRLGRGSRTAEPEPPRQRRNRPRLGLTVSGVPSEEALLNTSAGDTSPPETHGVTEQSVEASDAAILELAAGAALAEPAPAPIGDADEDDAAEGIPVALRGVVQDDAVIEAPGWPQPGELGLTSATDGFVAAADGLEAEVADPPLTLPAANDLITADALTHLWDDKVAEFDPASGWGQADEDAAEPPGETDSDWYSAQLDETVDEAWSLPQAIDHPAGEAFTTEATGLADEPDWNSSEWDFATVAAAPPIEIQSADFEHGLVADREFANPSAAEDEPTFSWPGEQMTIEPDDEPDPVVPATEPAPVDPPGEVPSLAPGDVEATVPAHATAWEPPATALTDSADDTVPAWTAPVAPPKPPKVDKRTRQLEKRLAAAEAELKRIAKRTKGKKGDLHKAGKNKIAKQVRKAIGDPRLAHHFDLEVGKGRFAFERRVGGELPLVTVGEPRPGGEGSELLVALEGPMRANLLAMLLRDYAHSEADRRAAAIRSQGGVAAGGAREFDALVARLAELSQHALLGIEPPHRSP